MRNLLLKISLTIVLSAELEIMSDGNEERHESRIRQEQERRENLEDRIHTDDVDEGEPERADS